MVWITSLKFCWKLNGSCDSFPFSSLIVESDYFVDRRRMIFCRNSDTQTITRCRKGLLLVGSKFESPWPQNDNNYGRFYTNDALSVWTNLGRHFVVRLVMRLHYKDGYKTHYASRKTTFRSASFKTYFEGQFVQTHNASCAGLYTWDA